jgi:hypothetical protein
MQKIYTGKQHNETHQTFLKKYGGERRKMEI